MIHLDLPTLDALHEKATPGPWCATVSFGVWQGPLVEDEEGCCKAVKGAIGPMFEIDPYNFEEASENDPHERMGEEIANDNALFIAHLRNAYPALSARIRELEAQRGKATAIAEEQEQLILNKDCRLSLLEETLRGIRQEKQQAHDSCVYDPIDADRLKEQIDQIDRVLKGEP